MRSLRCKWCLLFFIGLALLLGAAPGWAGILDQLDDTLKEAGVDISREVQNSGQEVQQPTAQQPSSAPDQPAALPVPQEQPATVPSGLPYEVAYRLQKMNQELEQAEQALGKVYQPAQERHQQARQHLNKALQYQSEIEQGYAGQYDLADPAVLATRHRLEGLQLTLAGNPAPAAPVAQKPRASGPALPILQRKRSALQARPAIRRPQPAAAAAPVPKANIEK